MRRTQIYLPENQIRLLKEKAYKEDISVSEVIRRFVSEGMEIKPKKVKGKRKRRNSGRFLMSLVKRAEKENWKGPKDLATNMDKHLYGEI